MSSVSDVNSTTPKGTSIFSATTKTPSSSSSGSSNDLGKSDFMNLLLAELKNQDPTQPMDNSQFLAQTAQFNVLEQMQTLNTSMTSLLTAQQLGQASGLIGKTVEATDANNKVVTGAVTGATMESGVAKVHIGDTVVDLDKVLAVAADASSLPKVDPPAKSGTSTGSPSANSVGSAGSVDTSA